MGAYTDFIGARYNAIAVLAALEHRRRTGEGQHIDLSRAEASIYFLAPVILAGGEVGRSGANRCQGRHYRRPRAKAGEFAGKSAESLRGRFAQGLGFSGEFAKAVDVQMKHGVNRGLITQAFGQTGESVARAFESRVARNPMADPEYAALINKFGPNADDARGIVSALRREEHAGKVMIQREAERLMKRQGALSVEGREKLTRSLVSGTAEEGVDAELYRDTFAFRAKIHEGLRDAGLISEETYQRNLDKYFPHMYEELYLRAGSPSCPHSFARHAISRIFPEDGYLIWVGSLAPEQDIAGETLTKKNQIIRESP